MKELTLQLSIEETNLILEALGTMPFSKVYTLIAKIQEQAGQQLKAEAGTQPEQAERTAEDSGSVVGT